MEEPPSGAEFERTERRSRWGNMSPSALQEESYMENNGIDQSEICEELNKNSDDNTNTISNVGQYDQNDGNTTPLHDEPAMKNDIAQVEEVSGQDTDRNCTGMPGTEQET